MIVKTQQYKAKFMAQNPSVLDTKINTKGQTCIFYEHPTLGDESTIYVMINDILADTEFFDLEDFYSGSDYEPILLDDGTILCKFETE